MTPALSFTTAPAPAEDSFAYKLGRFLRPDDGGTLAATPDTWLLADDDLAHHAAVLGGTGSGKSKLLERLMRCLMAAGRGFCFVDPHGDTSEDLLAYVAWRKQVEGDDALFRRIHYLEPSYEMMFAYDPFRFRPLHPLPDGQREAAFEAWLGTKVDSVCEVIQRKQGQMGFEGMPRLQRVLRDVLFAVGRAVDRRGKHLPLADALVLFDVHHKRHAEVFARVAPFLPGDVLSDFAVLHGFRRVEDLRRETESTVNRLRALLGPVVRAMFAQTAETIDFHGIMQRGEVILLNLRETDYFSADQKSAIGGLFIHEVLTTAANTPRADRRPFTLLVDEVGEFIGEDLMRALGAVRKYKLSLVLAGQDLSTFRKGEVDLAPKVLSQCGTVVCFQQTYADDLKVLADRLCRGNLSHDELYTVADRPDGYDLMDMADYSRGFTWTDNWTLGGAESDTETANWSHGVKVSRQQTWSRAESAQQAAGRTVSTSESEAAADSRGKTMTPLMRNGERAGTVTALSASRVATEGTQRSVADSLVSTTSTTAGEGGGVGVGEQWGGGGARALGLTRNAGVGGGEGGSVSVTHKQQLVPRTREEWHPTGRRRVAYADQMEMFMCLIYGLRQAQAVAKTRSLAAAIAVQVAHVKEMWHPDNKFRKVDEVKAALKALRSYYVPVQTGPAAEERRLDEYLRADDEPADTAAVTAGVPSRNGHRPGAGANGHPHDRGENPYGV
jgi:hypothetical protein